MTPELFESKLKELRNIEKRMMGYDHKTPITRVLTDRKSAQNIYDQLISAMAQIKEKLHE